MKTSYDRRICLKDTLAFIWKVCLSYPSGMICMAIMPFAIATEITFSPYAVGHIIDSLSLAQGRAALGDTHHAVFIFLLVLFIGGLAHRLFHYFFYIRMIPSLRSQIAEQNLKTILEKDYFYVQSESTGSLASRLKDVTAAVPDFLELLIWRILGPFCALMVSLYMLSKVHFVFSGLTFAWVGIFIGTQFLASSRLIHLGAEFAERGHRVLGMITDSIHQFLTVRLFRGWKQEKKLVSSLCYNAMHAERKKHWLYFWIFFALSFSFIAMHALNFYFLLLYYQNNMVSVGQFSLIVTLNMSIAHALWDCAFDFPKLSILLGRIQQSVRVFKEPVLITDAPEARSLNCPSAASVCIREISFAYPGRPLLFHKFSLDIPKGSKIGIAGFSGSGKSSLINLMLRFYDPLEGVIAIDGQDIRNVTKESLYQCVHVVTQETEMFHRTLWDNLTYGLTSIDENKVFQACQKVEMHDYIMSLPEKYQSGVGEKGSFLSGGQRQRLLLARSLLHETSVLMFDEATSQIDPLTEQKIQNIFWNELKEKTVVFVAHRLKTLTKTDKIFVLEQGCCVEEGRHEELLQKQGVYWRMWEAQQSTIV